MKITDDRTELAFFGDLEVTGLLESRENEGCIYMKIHPVILAESKSNIVYNAVDVETGGYAKFEDEEEIIPVYGSFHREGNING